MEDMRMRETGYVSTIILEHSQRQLEEIGLRFAEVRAGL